MAISEQFAAPLIPEEIYHIYNRTNNKESLFLNDRNRSFFLKKYVEYIAPYVTTYAFNLPDNHFHILVRIKSQEKILAQVRKLKYEELTLKEMELLLNPEMGCYCNYFIEWQFLRLFTSYSMAFNKVWNRNGNLFHKPFKRVHVKSDSHFSTALLYIHLNGVKHGLATTLADDEWSSYQHYKCGVCDLVEIEYAINWFGGKDKFEEYHRQAESFLDFGKGFAF